MIRQWGEQPPDETVPVTVLEAPDAVPAEDPSADIAELEFELPKPASPVLDELDPVRLRAVQDVLIDPSLVLRATRSEAGAIADFVCEDANQAAADSLEVDRGDLIGSLLTEMLPGPVGEFLFEQCVDAVASGDPLRFDDYEVGSDEGGPIRHYDIRGMPLDERMCFTWRDVSGRIHDRRALAESRNRYRLLAEHSSDVVLLLTPEGAVEWSSPSTRSMLGWDPEDLVGREFADLVQPEDRELLGSMGRHPSTVGPVTSEMRFRCAGGTYLWVAVSMGEAFDDDGVLINRVCAVRNIHTRVQVRRDLASSEDRFRTLAENVSDIVLATESGRITWVSPSVEWVLGWQPEDLIGSDVMDLIVPDDHPGATEAMAAVTRGDALELLEFRFLTSSGESRWMQVHSRSVDPGPPPHHAFVTGLQDIHDRRADRRVLDALAAVNGVLVGADDESTLLADVCRVLVDGTGFSLAWFGMGPGVDGAPAVITSYGESDGLPGTVTRAPGNSDPIGVGSTALATGRTDVRTSGDEHAASPAGSGPRGERRIRTTVGIPVEVDGRVDLVLVLDRMDSHPFQTSTSTNFDQIGHQVGMALSGVRARRHLVEALNEQALLSTAIEQAGESVMIADVDGTVVYANPATAVTTGYPLEEILGGTTAKFASGLHDKEFYKGIRETLRAGGTWRGVMVNRNRDGELYEEDSTVTAVRDDRGEITAYVSVLRNITRELKLEADLHRLRSDRDSVVAAMTGVRVGSTIEATAASFCRAVARLEDIDVARVLLVDSDEQVVPLGITGTAYLNWEVGVPIDIPHLTTVLEVTRAGSWWLPLDTPVGPDHAVAPLVAPLIETGFESVGFAPIWWEGRMVGVLTVLSRTPESLQWGEARTTVLDELSSYAGTMLGAHASRRSEWKRLRDEIRDIIDHVGFHPVFQPVIALDGGDVHGYEALTRFASGRRPDLVFEDAHSVGLGIELETACAVAAVRAAVAACPGVRISVDDAGAGYASLRHILELQPDFVKLDIGLVRNIDADPARQALAAGLRHYADTTGNVLIAEGVETQAESATLHRLGIPLAQGFLFGRPTTIAQMAA